jgi:hypothetical protein
MQVSRVNRPRIPDCEPTQEERDVLYYLRAAGLPGGPHAARVPAPEALASNCPCRTPGTGLRMRRSSSWRQVAVWVAVHRRAVPSVEDQPTRVVLLEPNRTAATRAANAVGVRDHRHRSSNASRLLRPGRGIATLKFYEGRDIFKGYMIPVTNPLKYEERGASATTVRY